MYTREKGDTMENWQGYEINTKLDSLRKEVRGTGGGGRGGAGGGIFGGLIGLGLFLLFLIKIPDMGEWIIEKVFTEPAQAAREYQAEIEKLPVDENGDHYYVFNVDEYGNIIDE